MRRMAVISATRIQLPQYRESCSAIAYPYSSIGARKWWSSYHVEVAQTGCDRDSSDIGGCTQRLVVASGPSRCRASEHGNAEPDHCSASQQLHSDCVPSRNDIASVACGGELSRASKSWVGGVTGCGQKCAVKRHFPIAMLEGPVTLSPDDANPQTNGQRRAS